LWGFNNLFLTIRGVCERVYLEGDN